MAQEREWQHDLCDVKGHCWEGLCCPCLILNKTAHLLRDPTEQDPDGCGKWCFGWCIINCFTGAGGNILACIQRGKVREDRGIEGSACGDFCASLCCPCCVMIQQYKELEYKRDHEAIQKPYQAQAPMSHP
ncbi:hypothetical protein VTK26DRAFT_3188 [Humicola hyalothermophila]